MALDSVRGHKFRSFLTVLGIVIGVMTAISIASILTGMRQNIVVDDRRVRNEQHLCFPSLDWSTHRRRSL